MRNLQRRMQNLTLWKAMYYSTRKSKAPQRQKSCKIMSRLGRKECRESRCTCLYSCAGVPGPKSKGDRKMIDTKESTYNWELKDIWLSDLRMAIGCIFSTSPYRQT